MVVLFWPKYSPGNCSPEGWEWKVAVGTLTQHRRDFFRTVGESYIGGSHEGVQTWKPKGAVTKGFPQRSESQDSHSRVPQGHSPRRELTAVIQWQGNPCIYYCYLWCATAPHSLFLADYKANELSYTSLDILLFSWYNYSASRKPVSKLFWSKFSPFGIIYHYVFFYLSFFYMYWSVPNNCYCLCSWRV